MIRLTRFDTEALRGFPLYVLPFEICAMYSDIYEHVDSNYSETSYPVTIICLKNKKEFMVAESVEEITSIVSEYFESVKKR